MAIADEIPDIFPLGQIVVENETHSYNTNEDEDGNLLEVTEYDLDKGPAKRVEEVIGIVDSDVVVFEKGKDYEVSADKERIVFLDGGRRPDVGSDFQVTYRADSVISRYLSAHDEEYRDLEAEIAKLEERRLLDNATGDQLDRIGELFGALGQRFGRDDQEYRFFLKSVLQSFVSRGTRDDIKTAISAATDVPKEDIIIRENFEKNEYGVDILAATPVTGSVIEEVTEIADPSGVKLARTRFRLPPDEIGVTDSTSNRSGENIVSDEAGVTDGVSIPSSTTAADSMVVTDDTKSGQTAVAWDESEWNTMYWATEHE